MKIYRQRFLPWMTCRSMRHHRFASYRRQVLPAATGRVLEIGIGSGANLPYYGPSALQIVGLDPSTAMLEWIRTAPALPNKLTLIGGSADAIPLDDRSVDTVVTTWTMCLLPSPERSLAEMRRVLKPSGRLLFAEHGCAPEPWVRWCQDRLTPLWKHINGGCHLHRPIAELIEKAGFRLERLENSYMIEWLKPMTYIYMGSARSN